MLSESTLLTPKPNILRDPAYIYAAQLMDGAALFNIAGLSKARRVRMVTPTGTGPCHMPKTRSGRIAAIAATLPRLMLGRNLG